MLWASWPFLFVRSSALPCRSADRSAGVNRRDSAPILLNMNGRIDRAARFLRDARHAVALTGAGVSAESGIPTYRGEGGFWRKYDPDRYASYDYFLQDPSYYWRFFLEIRHPLLEKSRPNQAHLCLARLEADGRLVSVITQNIDGLHQAAGSKTVRELHGSARLARCMSCKTEYTIDEVLPAESAEIPPRCEGCGGVVRPGVVLFGESLPPDVLDRAIAEAQASDLLITIGSSLTVYPAAAIPEIARAGGARLIVVNVDPTPVDLVADVVFHARAGAILPQILARI